jgi:hypothetical protein
MNAGKPELRRPISYSRAGEKAAGTNPGETETR